MKGIAEPFLDMAFAKVADGLQPNCKSVTGMRRSSGPHHGSFCKLIRAEPNSEAVLRIRREHQAKDRPADGYGVVHDRFSVCYTELKFIGESAQYYLFKPLFPHPGHDAFEGTSGVPICDRF